jgi:N-acetyl-gamma-glutamyl-phosphate reductase
MQNKCINIVIAGATGFTGLDLTLFLSKHSNVKIKYLCAQKNIGKEIQFFDDRIKKKLPKISKLENVSWNKIDLIFLSLPNGQAQKIVSKLYFKHPKLKFIDLSADFRLTNPNMYKKWYKINHKAKNLIKDSIYSISEFSKDKIRNFRIISNPGCYPTSIQLALVPLLKKKLIKVKNITIDSKSGYSGAGKTYKKKFASKNLLSSTIAYSVNEHRHMAEIDQELKKVTKKIEYTFNPHLIPTFRGLLSTIYVDLNKNVGINKIAHELKKFYKKDRFIKILKNNISLGTGNVLNTNNCEMSVSKTRVRNKLIIFSSIDNLVKGASGQAIQNMNLLFKFKVYKSLK